MKRFILGGMAVILTASQVLAVPVAVPGTLTDYINLGATGATLGSTLFSDFTLLPTQTDALQISPDSILVNPINLSNNPTLQFSVNQTALAGELFELRLSYKVSDFSLSGAGVSLVDPIATGDAAITATLDLTGPVPQSPTLIAFAIEGLSGLTDQTNFAGVPMLQVQTDIVVDGGLSGQGILGSATNRFTVASVPEPASAAIGLTLFGVLIAHGWLQRRQTRRP